MNSRVVQLLLALSLLLNCFVLAGFVYRSWIAPPFGEHTPGPPPPPGGRQAPLEMMMNDLKLDDSQRKAMQDGFEKNTAERRERIHQIQLIREQTSDELKKQPVDLAKVDSLIEKISKLREDQQKLNLRGILEMDGHLTPQQRERMHQILAERYLGSGGPGRPGGAGRPGAPPGAGRPPQ
jgi:Spy/CpxP family protein refolding chaperone